MFSFSTKSISCPSCDQTIRITNSSWIQAFELGSFCECEKCSHEWLLKFEPQDVLEKRSASRFDKNPLVMINLANGEFRRIVEMVVEEEGFEIVEGSFNIDETLRLDQTRLGCLIQDIDELNDSEVYYFQDILSSESCVRVIVYSQSHNMDSIGRYLQKGAFDFQVSSFDIDRFRLRLNQAIIESSRRRTAHQMMSNYSRN